MAWWKFDETEGDTATDSSGQNHNGMLMGEPQWQPSGGKIGGALAFDGIDDYIDCGSHEDLYWFNGLIDDLKIYNYPLAETEIAALYSGEGPQVVAQVEAPTTTEEEPQEKSNWISVLIVVAIAIVVGVFVAFKRKRVT